MNRPEPVMEAFAELARTLVGDFDLAETLDRVIDHCVAACGAASVGLVVQDASGTLRDIAYSDDRVRRLERRQIAAGEGPCFDCVQTGRPVLVDDLGATRDRWPDFTPAALEAGYTGVRALPLRHRRQTLGALNLFDQEPGRCTDTDLLAAQAFADLALLAVLQHAQPESPAAHITRALAARSAIERAKGMIANDAGSTVEHALVLLRGHAERTGRGTTAVARALLSGEVTTAEVLAAPAPPGD
ncbi:GAF and ANTAR domain-containing protein [Kitasatospora sp. NPDC059646]|uniref:GAF and ANTAR domain-containing protein n=1 Tax=Kitasatospora sp. NPDC059646 TaxID=3346893 RepID=UPI00367B48C6